MLKRVNVYDKMLKKDLYVLSEKAVLKNFTKFTGKHLC